jgi:hypothetical protein
VRDVERGMMIEGDDDDRKREMMMVERGMMIERDGD